MPRIIDLARTNLIKIDISSSFKDIAELMLQYNIGSVIITKDDDIIGFIDEITILQLIAEGKNPINCSINKYISKFPTLDYNTKVLDVWDIIKDEPFERYGVVKEGKIIGIVRKRTINDFRVRILREELHIEDDLF